MERVPQFLSQTLVNITKTLLFQKDYFRDHPIWLVLEQELFKRRNTLNNEQLTQVMHSFGVSGNGSQQFFYEMEEVITDSPLPIETEYLQKIMKGYSEVDQGTPVFYSMLVEKILDRGIELLSIEQIMEITKSLAKATNTHKGGFGFYAAMEKHVRNNLF